MQFQHNKIYMNKLKNWPKKDAFYTDVYEFYKILISVMSSAECKVHFEV